MTCLKDFGYDDIKVIGRGQYGKAHLCTHGEEKNTCIAKTIDLTCLSNKEREAALQEVELLRRLDHPNIVEYRDNFFMGDTLVIAMQYCEGGDLAAYIKEMARQKMRIREVQIMNYFVQVLQALQYIHGERILHRDLKTSNLFLMKSKSIVKLGDFGISRVLEGSTLAAITVVGTPYYMSPEVCENKPYTFKSDVWSLGCVQYELCMLKHAFSADNLLGLVYKIVSDKYEAIPKMYSQALNTLIQRMLEKKAELRPSVHDLFSDSYVQSFMNEYVRTRGGLCSTSSSGGGGSSGSRAPPGGGAPRPPPRAGGRTSTGDTAGSGTAAAQAAGERRPRPARPGHHRGNANAGPGGKSETPKEAAARRKREASDKQAEQLKAAAKQSVHNKDVARRMKDAEFKTTRIGSLGRGATSPASGAISEAGVSAVSTADGGERLTAAADGGDSGSEPYDEDDGISEEISEYSEEYEDDFEDDFATEDEGYSEIEEEPECRNDRNALVGGQLSTVKEDQDWTRVMTNYEQAVGTREAPPRPAPAPVPQPAPASATAVAPGAPAAVMDIHSRAKRVREDLVEKMGSDTFTIAFDFLLQARKSGIEERSVRRQLEELIGKEMYKKYGFEVDQLVFQQTHYS